MKGECPRVTAMKEECQSLQRQNYNIIFIVAGIELLQLIVCHKWTVVVLFECC